MANVSFGIFVFMPHGWAFMVAIVLIEISLISRMMAGKWWDWDFMWLVSLANAISGAIGFVASMVINGGWWLVVWMPWVSSNEVKLEEHLTKFGIYYACAFIVSVATEGLVEHFMLKRYAKKKVWFACLTSNVASYALGGALMYSLSFGL